MKKFEDIYAELVKEHGSDSGEEFAKAMFNAGSDVSFTQNLKDLVTNEEIMVSLLTFNAIAMAERAVKVNAADLSISTELMINEKNTSLGLVQLHLVLRKNFGRKSCRDC